MTYQELLELKSNRAAKLKEGNDLLTKKDFEAHKNLLAEVAKMNAEIDAAEGVFISITRWRKSKRTLAADTKRL